MRTLAGILVVLACLSAGPRAHPGENGYWLIEVKDNRLTSRVLLPDHLLMHLSGEDEDLKLGDLADRQVRLRLLENLRGHLTLESELPLVPVGAGELHLEPGGFVELITSCALPAGASTLRVGSSLQTIAGEDYQVLCRVMGGEPESFVLDARSSLVELTLSPESSSDRGSIVFGPSLGGALYGLLILLICGVSILGLRRLRSNGPERRLVP